MAVATATATVTAGTLTPTDRVRLLNVTKGSIKDRGQLIPILMRISLKETNGQISAVLWVIENPPRFNYS